MADWQKRKTKKKRAVNAEQREDEAEEESEEEDGAVQPALKQGKSPAFPGCVGVMC
jgi:hypothetical protein